VLCTGDTQAAILDPGRHAPRPTPAGPRSRLPPRRRHRTARLDARGAHRRDVSGDEAVCDRVVDNFALPAFGDWAFGDWAFGDWAFGDWVKAGSYDPTLVACRSIVAEPERVAALDQEAADLASRHDHGGGTTVTAGSTCC
jgi:hypothetical protein